jgi:DNA polymerase elongation subunit (family B)
MGLEAIKSSTPSSCRVAIKKAMTIIMNGDEPMLQSYIAEFRETFRKLPFEDIAFPRGVQGLKKQRGKSEGIPIHVRGALAYNKNLNNMKLTKKYEEIKEGEKIRFCYLRMPNHIHENVLSVPHTLPKEFALDSYIDYNVQFDKAFLQPLKSILNVIDWKDEKRNTIEDFFS